jgi:dTDP-4-amino-4,6-dideoxygalactose transaminase
LRSSVYRGRPVGSWGAAGCFSLQESKAVSGGEGGILTTSNAVIYQRAMTLGHHPLRLADELTDPDLLPLTEAAASYKFRMPALAAVIALQQLRSLPEQMQVSVQYTIRPLPPSNASAPGSVSTGNHSASTWGYPPSPS